MICTVTLNASIDKAYTMGSDLEAGTVKSRLFRARRRLCDFLLADGNLPDRYASKQTKGGADG